MLETVKFVGAGQADASVVVKNANMPSPFDEAVTKNVKKQVYQRRNIYSLGDYFNQTIVDVVLNFLSLLFLFVCIRIVLGFILRMIDYGRKGLPALKQYDAVFSCGIGFLHGMVLLYIFFMLLK